MIFQRMLTRAPFQTVSSAHALFLALAMYPEVQRKAQAEIDSITDGGSRLPTMADKEQLPYLQALLKELGRWHTVGPLGIAHQSVEDDVYNGYFIPRKTIIFPNVW